MRYLLMFIFLSTSLFSQNPLHHKFTEYGILSFPQGNSKAAPVAGQKERMDNLSINDSISKLFPLTQSFTIDSSQKSVVIGKHGTRLEFPTNAFRFNSGLIAAGNIKIELIEVFDGLDFMLSRIGLIYYDNLGREEYMETNGMFKVEAFLNGERLYLASNNKIDIQVPDFFPDKNFQFYRMSFEGQWKERDDLYIKSNREKYKDEYGTLSARIDDFSWYTFANHTKESACFKGKVDWSNTSSGKKLQVFSVGQNYKSYFTKISNSNDFDIVTHKNKRVKIVVVDDNNNLFVSEEMVSPIRKGTDKYPDGADNYKHDLKTVLLKKIPDDVYKDRDKFLEYLGFSKETRKIKYKE